MNKKITIWHTIWAGLMLTIGAGFVILVLPIVLLNDLIFGRYRGWNYNINIFRLVFAIMYFLSGIRVRTTYEAPHDRNRRYVFVFNHNSYLDILIMLTALRQPARILSKTGIDKVPVFGYYYRKSTVMVDRGSMRSRVESLRGLKHYLDKGISIVIFPEGTFNESHQPLKSFFDGAFRLAIETQTNIKPVITPDNYDRSPPTGFGLRPGKARIIYLPEVSVQGMTMQDVPALKDAVYAMMEEALIRHRASWIKN